MATDQHPQPTDAELAALRDYLQEVPAAVYLPTDGRILVCPNLVAPAHECERTLTIPDAQLLAARVRAGELGPIHADAEPIVFAYGIPWSW